MTSSPRNPAEDDVQRLLKQMNMAAFQFRSFNRPNDDDGSSEFDATAPDVDSPSAPPPAPLPELRPVFAPPPLAPAPAPAPPAKASTAAVIESAEAVPVDEALGRLIRSSEPRAKRKPSLQLRLPPRPKVIDVVASNSGDLPIADVLNRLCRLVNTKISLVRHRGDA